jgi:hypothetical protein
VVAHDGCSAEAGALGDLLETIIRLLQFQLCSQDALTVKPGSGCRARRGQAVFVADEQWLGIRGAGTVFVASTGE